MPKCFDINDVLKRCSELAERSQGPPRILLMTTWRYESLKADLKQLRPEAADVPLALNELYGVEIEHFEDMPKLYDRAAELIRGRTKVGIIAEEPCQPNPPQFITDRRSSYEFAFFNPMRPKP